VIEDTVSGVTPARASGSLCLGLATSFSADQLMFAAANWTAAYLAAAPEAALAL